MESKIGSLLVSMKLAYCWATKCFFNDLCCDYISAAPLEEDVEVLSDYLIRLVGTQNLEQLWRVFKFLDRYATKPSCCFNSSITNIILVRKERRAFRARVSVVGYRQWLVIKGQK